MDATRPADRIRVLELRSVLGTGGGPEKTILLGAERRDRAHFDVTVCYIRDLRDGNFGIDGRASQTDIDYTEIRERNSFDVTAWRGLIALARDRKIDIVHAHEYKSDLLALWLARKCRIHALATSHGWTGNSFFEKQIYYRLDKWLLTRFPRVIAVSSEIRDEIVSHGADGGRVSVLLNAVDPVAFHRTGIGATVRRELGLPEQAIIIGAVGRVEQQKRFDLLLDALRGILPNRNAHLVIAGEGSLRASLEARAAALSIRDRCHFIGHYADIRRLHEALDVLVQSSDYEGTPNVVLEAMAMETALVATDVGGTRELAFPDVHALIVAKGDVAGLSASVDAVLTDPAGARTRIKAARERVETELSFETRTRRLEKIYTDLAGRTPDA